MTRIEKQHTDFILNRRRNEFFTVGDYHGVECIHKPVILGFLNDVNTNYGSCDVDRVLTLNEYGREREVTYSDFESRWQSHIWQMSHLARETKNLDLHQQLLDVSSKIIKDYFDLEYDRQNNNLN